MRIKRSGRMGTLSFIEMLNEMEERSEGGSKRRKLKWKFNGKREEKWKSTETPEVDDETEAESRRRERKRGRWRRKKKKTCERFSSSSRNIFKDLNYIAISPNDSTPDPSRSH